MKSAGLEGLELLKIPHLRLPYNSHPGDNLSACCQSRLVKANISLRMNTTDLGMIFNKGFILNWPHL